MNLLHIDSADRHARRGKLMLSGNAIESPVFMPVGTVGAMKALHHAQLETLGYKLILGNTYHLYLRPGLELLKQAGGLRSFAAWPGSLLTDSGGFQFFSLAPFCKFTDDGVKFRSHIDGSYHFFTPEFAIEAQEAIGSDIHMALDVCTPPEISEKKALGALLKTAAWAKRCKARWQSGPQRGALFGIVQGNFYKELRKRSALELAELDLPGYAIGGLSVGEEKNVYRDFLAYTAELLPQDKPRYVMGIGTPDYILEAVENGIDMFDCVYPTRVARNGAAMTADGLISLKAERFKEDQSPIEENCPCHACRRYSRAYLRHLVRASEINALTLITEHNLTFMARFMEECRKAIAQQRFTAFKEQFLARYYNK